MSLPHNLPQTYTSEEVAEALQISVKSLQRARQAGTLRFVRLGHLVRHTDKHVADFLASRERGGVRGAR